ncbi:MAG: IS1595 family transposase [Sphingomonas sp.]|uniref:IS1595 family transposase n=1 Tax=Sphingomonas sp. TaxID=28214 RepID=UPI0017A5E73D|nr:IS1595 family transposase [Sphingomonas sp.]MBA3667873.1 IS1595 family transposase [Sphingomonas sp.]
MSVLSQPRFHDEAKAFEYLESMIWTDGVTCPHCGVVGGRIYKLDGVRGKPSKKCPKGAIRYGLKKCGECRKQFTVKVGTVFEDAKLPLHIMLQAVHLMISSKKGISSHQLSRVLEIQYNSAWFLSHRIREALRSGELAPFGSGGGIVEVDETFIGRIKGAPKKRAFHHKMKVLALIDRDSGIARTMIVDNVSAATLMPIVRANVAREATIMTDEHNAYRSVRREFAGHGTTNHNAGQYVDLTDRTIHSNTVEGYFSIFKRGMKGVYQHCGEQHLHRYLAEFEFRYNTRTANGFDDRARAIQGLKGIVGKRLTYGVSN